MDPRIRSGRIRSNTWNNLSSQLIKCLDIKTLMTFSSSCQLWLHHLHFLQQEKLSSMLLFWLYLIASCSSKWSCCCCLLHLNLFLLTKDPCCGWCRILTFHCSQVSDDWWLRNVNLTLTMIQNICSLVEFHAKDETKQGYQIWFIKQ